LQVEKLGGRICHAGSTGYSQRRAFDAATKSTFHHRATGGHVQGDVHLIGVSPQYATTTR
jgi:hypothetical protein